jgi:hypothetical protein
MQPMADYATTVEAQAYIDERLFGEAWDQATASDQTRAIKMATKIIDRLNFLGVMTDSAQDNQFPRDEDTTIPSDIRDACIELALALLDGRDPEMEFENISMVDMRIADIRSNYNRDSVPEHIIAGVPSATAWRLLKPYIRSPLEIRLDRV